MLLSITNHWNSIRTTKYSHSFWFEIRTYGLPLWKKSWCPRWPRYPIHFSSTCRLSWWGSRRRCRRRAPCRSACRRSLSTLARLRWNNQRCLRCRRHRYRSPSSFQRFTTEKLSVLAQNKWSHTRKPLWSLHLPCVAMHHPLNNLDLC